MNRINIFLEHIFEGCSQQENMSVEDMLLYAKGLGIDGLECDLWRLSDKLETKKLFDSCGMEAESIYNMFDFGHEPWSVSEAKVYNLLETAAFFGTKKVLAIPGLIRNGDDRSRVADMMCGQLNKMCEAAKKYNITVTLEDFDDISAPFCTTEGLEYFMKNTEGLGFTFDTGNFAYCLEDAAEAYERLKKYIAHVHLKDRSYDMTRADKNNTNGKTDLSGRIMYPCEVGSGTVGMEKLIKKLIEDGYTGSLSIEHFGAANQMEYMKKSAENIHKYIS